MAPSMRYLVVRSLLFLVPFAVLMIAQVPWLLSLLVSLAFAFAASIVFFGTLRQEAAADLQRMREGRKREGAGPDDGDIEDSVLDAPGPDAHEPAERSDADGRRGGDRRGGDAADEPDASRP
ncbi:MAG: DUF4229 domain-containing protein [Actinomycetota bacterium]